VTVARGVCGGAGASADSVVVRIAVVGGGIGGITAAIALARKGVSTTVFEQAPALAAVGASLQLGPNATRLLGELGLLDALRAVSVRPDAVDLLRWDDGSLLLHAEHGEAAERHFGAPQLDFFRPDLQRALVDALDGGVLRLGARVAGIAEAGDEVEVVLESGERHRADGVVAADGIRSPLRQQLVGADEPVFAGMVVYRGVVDYARAAELHPDGVNRYWVGPDRHGVSYRVGPGGRLLAFNLGVRRPEPAQESWTLEAPAEEAAGYLDGWDPSLVERIRRCGTVLRGAVYVRRPLERWSFGRVTLLGDAAHAMEPFQAQGAAQSVEDAYVLAECVGAAGGDVEAAFARYERIRTARAAELQATSRGAGGDFFLPDGPEQRARDEAFGALARAHPWGTRSGIWEYDVRRDLEELGVA
jgi:salicylate hydroxylase